MATEVVMPKLGLTMETGTVGAWLIEEGQSIEKGQPLLEVVTDKVTMEVEAQVAGILRKVLVPAGAEVAVTTVIGIIAAPDESIDVLLASQSAAEPATPVPVPQEDPPSPSPGGGRQPVSLPVAPTASLAPGPSSDGQRSPHRASPKARKILAESGIDAGLLVGSGPRGRIVSADVEAYLAQQPVAAGAGAPAASGVLAASPAGALVELTRPQQVAAERLTASSRDIPHIHLSMDVSAVWLKQLRDGFKAQGKRISHNDMIVRAVGRALTDFPRLNSVLEGSSVRQLEEINVGIAVDSPQGLLVPVMRRVAGKNLEELAAEAARLIEGARRGELGLDDLMGGTFTISNLGMLGVSHFTAIINPPQVAILAVGAIEQRVVALENNALMAQPRLTLTLAADHRVVDGALGARFLQRLREILENPGLLG